MRINRQIRADKIRLIGAEGQQIGIMTVREGLIKAQEAGLDLVEISPTAVPPVCRIVDYGKFKYQLTKKEKDSKKAQHQVKMKEIKFKPNIDKHDFMTKAKHARDFLSKGHKVRFTCSFRGREMLLMDLGEKVIAAMCEDLSDIATIEAPIKRMGRMITTVVAPTGKKAKNIEKEN